MDPLPSSRGVPPSTQRPVFTRSGRKRRPPAKPAGRDHQAECGFAQRFEAALQRAKLDALKELAYGASHEINNPLANIALRMQTLLKRESDPEKRKLLTASHRAAMRAHEMISDLMLFARPPAPQKAEVRLVESLDRVLAEMCSFAEERGVSLSRRQGGEDAVAWADAVQVDVIIKALVDNAIEAIGRSGSEGAVSVAAFRRDEGNAGFEVLDDGPGVDESIRPHIFDPFFSGREAGRGLGFGLSKCWRIVTGHGGELRLENAEPSGVRVTVVLPAALRDQAC